MQKSRKRSRIGLFGSLAVMTIAAMLTAMSVVIGIFCKSFLNFGVGLFRVTFENLPILLAGIMFGPAVGGVVGALITANNYKMRTLIKKGQEELQTKLDKLMDEKIEELEEGTEVLKEKVEEKIDDVKEKVNA